MIVERQVGKDTRKEVRPPKGIIASQTLLLDAQKFYNWVLPPELQRRYEELNDGIVRMGGLRESGLVPDGFVETNLDHIISLLAMAREYNERYPVLRERINYVGVQIYGLGHDLGELVTGDIKPLDRTVEEERRKRVEPRAGRRYVLPKIPNPEARKRASELYSAYTENDPENLTVQMAHFIDKTQGTTRVAEIVFNVHRMPEKTAQIELHLSRTICRMMKPAINLMTNLETREERSAMGEILLGEIRLLEEYCPEHVGDTFRKEVERLIE